MIFSKLLMGAFLIASVSMFVSCKDYDDDISKNSQEITALKSQLESLRSTLSSELSAAKSELNTAIAKKADASELDKKADASELEKKANASDLTALEARVAALEAQIKAIDECAKKSDLDAVSALLAVLDGDVDKAQETADAAKAQADLQKQALENFQKSVADAGYLTEADKTALNKAIEELKKQVEGITISEDVEAMKKQFNDLETALTQKIDNAISVLTVLVDKKLTGLVLIPDFYWEGIEGIEVPFMNTPEFKENGKYEFTYTVTGYTDGDRQIKVKVDNTMGWLATDGTIMNSETDKTWAPYMGWSKPAATSSGQTTHYSLIDRDGTALAASLKKNVQFVLIANGGEANYHINPGAADLTGYKYSFFENDAPVYTRNDNNIGSINATPKEDQVTASKGILNVPFTVDYLKMWRYFYVWAFQNNTYAQYQTHDKNANNTSWTYSNGYEPRWDNEYETYVNWYTTWVSEGFDAEGNEIGHYEPIFQGSDRYKNSNFGTSDMYADDGKYLGQDEAKLPFISLTATKDTTVNSDYAVVVPAIINIVALADKEPNTALSQNTFVNNHTDKDTDAKLSTWGRITNNHLYETVGIEGTYDIQSSSSAYYYNGPGAIPSPATHGVVYNGSIDLKPFVQTHASYTTYTRYGQSTVDRVLTDKELADLNLRYEFKKIDYIVGNEKTSESAHIEEGEEGVFYPRSVREDGSTILGQVATKEVIDREPLIRVDLIHKDKDGNDHIVRYGYIKLRIVEDEVADLDVEFELSDIYMNCGGFAKLTWSQVEAGILQKLNMSKQNFEDNYRFLDQAYHWNMPTNANGALFDVADANQFWGQRFYTKDGKVVAAADTYAENDAVNTFDYTKWTADNNWFGRVWYTPHDNATYAHSWDEQTNVLIWDLHAYDSKIIEADQKAVNAKSTYWRGNMKNVNGITDDALYQKLMSVAGVSYESKGVSTQAISTIVRFVNKNTGNYVNVKLTIPAGKLHFEYGDVSNKDWSHWFAFNYGEYEGFNPAWGVEGTTDAEKPYWRELDAHMNTFKPSNNGYKFLKVTDYNQMLTDNWLDPTKMVRLLGDKDKFTKFYGNADPELGQAATVEFLFTYPVKDVNSENVSASEIEIEGVKFKNAWKVTGASGTVWTLQVRAHNGVDNTAIYAVGKNDKLYGPEEVVYLDNTLVKDGVNIAVNNQIHYHGLETGANLYPAATDLLNKMGAYDAQGNEQFELGSGLTNMISAYYLGDNIDRTFTAYLQLKVSHDLCYDPLIGKTFFNARFHRPINVVGKEITWNDRVLNDNKLEIRKLVEVVDWNRFAVVAFGGEKVAAKNTMTGIEQPKYADVYASATKMKQQNLGIPFEYYGISELAVRYDEIRTDHAKEPSVRNNKFYDPAEIKANTDLVKDLNSLISERETGKRTLHLLNADGTVVSYTTAHAYNHSDLNATGNGTKFGWLYYNNNASGVQRFHIYVPIAVKYNWGNIAYDYLLDAAGAKLDKDYTQTVWAIITVEGTH